MCSRWEKVVKKGGKVGLLKTPRFRGQFVVRLDDKGRLRIPTKLRETLQQNYTDGLILAAGPRWLDAYPPEVWEILEEKIMAKAGLHEDYRALIRYYIASGVESEIDKQGRILIPSLHRDRANIQQEVLVVGSLDHIEIWDMSQWREYDKWAADNFERLSKEAYS